jgi:hypothetical protein
MQALAAGYAVTNLWLSTACLVCLYSLGTEPTENSFQQSFETAACIFDAVVPCHDIFC